MTHAIPEVSILLAVVFRVFQPFYTSSTTISKVPQYFFNAFDAPSDIIHGDASGAVRLSGEWAAAKGIKIEARPAECKKHGRAAGPIRNSQMLDKKPELVVAFPGGKETADTVEKAKQAGLEVVMVSSERG